MLVFVPDRDANCALSRNLNRKTKRCFLSCVVEILTYRLRLEALIKEIVMFLCEISGCRECVCDSYSLLYGCVAETRSQYLQEPATILGMKDGADGSTETSLIFI